MSQNIFWEPSLHGMAFVDTGEQFEATDFASTQADRILIKSGHQGL